MLRSAPSTPDRIRSADLRVPFKETVYLITKKHRPLPARYPMIRELLAAQWPQGVWLRCGKLGQRFADALPLSLRLPLPYVPLGKSPIGKELHKERGQVLPFASQK